MWGVGSRFKSYERKIRIEYREKKKEKKKGVNIFIQRKKKCTKTVVIFWTCNGLNLYIWI